MNRPNRNALCLSLVCLAFAVGCVNDATTPGSESGDGGGATGPLLPWAVGYSWTYDVTDNGTVTRKVTTVGPEETVGGTGPHAADLAFKVVTSKKDGTDKTVSWQAVDGHRIVRYREQAFSASTGQLAEEEHWKPSKLHVDGSDEHTAKGASWLEIYKETKIPAGGTEVTAEARDVWTVEAVGQTVTVPYGTFDDAIVLIKAGGSQKKYWYVRGVGKVKESGTQTEELVDFEVGQ